MNHVFNAFQFIFVAQKLGRKPNPCSAGHLYRRMCAVIPLSVRLYCSTNGVDRLVFALIHTAAHIRFGAS